MKMAEKYHRDAISIIRKEESDFWLCSLCVGPVLNVLDSQISEKM